jgi:DNA polymerase
MFIGEAPGANEDIKGEPFVGQSGKLLDNLLSSIELDRDSVYITNTVKCRPPNNRDPLPSELDICQDHWLDAQIAIIEPKIIIPLGRHALNRILPGTTIGKSHGQTFSKLGFTIFPIYHPAAGLRQIRYKQLLVEDFKTLKTLLGNKREPTEEPKSHHITAKKNQQINLF